MSLQPYKTDSLFEMKKIAIKPVGDHNIASSRLRAYKPCRLLKNKIAIEIYQKKNIHEYSSVIFQKSYSESDIEIAKILKQKKIKIVLDQCDNHNIFNPDNNAEKQRAVRMSEMGYLADAIFASTQEIANLYPEKPTFVLPDFIDFHKPNPLRSAYYSLIYPHLFLRDRLKLVWFGNAGSSDQHFGLFDLQKKLPWLNSLAKRVKLSLTVVSNSKVLFNEIFYKNLETDITYIEWSNQSYRYIVSMHDACIIPITRNPFTICKTNNRIALALSLGLPVIADSIPSYLEFSAYAVLDDWETASDLLATQLIKLKTLAGNGKKYISENYSDDKVAEKWFKALKTFQ